MAPNNITVMKDLIKPTRESTKEVLVVLGKSGFIALGVSSLPHPYVFWKCRFLKVGE